MYKLENLLLTWDLYAQTLQKCHLLVWSSLKCVFGGSNMVQQYFWSVQATLVETMTTLRLIFWLICHFASSLTSGFDVYIRVGGERDIESNYSTVGRWLGWWWCQWWLLCSTEKGIGKQHREEVTKPSQSSLFFSRLDHRFLFGFIYFPLCSTHQMQWTLVFTFKLLY